VSRVIACSAQDAHTLLHVYPELGVRLPESARVITLGDALAEAGDALKISPLSAQSYTIHDAAQSNRLTNHAANVRTLAERVMGSAPREMLFRENLATPLSAGGLEFSNPALAEKLAWSRIAEARETGAEIILTDDPLDTAILEKYANGIRVLNLYTVLADRMQVQ
jgi:Fe-S oxidoreductase